MVKNRSNGLRNSSSVMSLRSSVQDDAASRRIAELEAQVDQLSKANATSEFYTRNARPYDEKLTAYNQVEWDHKEIGDSLVYKRANGQHMDRPGSTMYQEYADMMRRQPARPENALKAPEAYTEPFCTFLTDNPTVWHAVDYFEKKLQKAGFEKVISFSMT